MRAREKPTMHRRRQTAAVQSVKRKKYDCSCFKLVELWPWSAIINKNINTTLPWRARRISAYSQYNTLPYLRAYPVVRGVGPSGGLSRDSASSPGPRTRTTATSRMDPTLITGDIMINHVINTHSRLTQEHTCS